jgi:hypothetical protein
MPKLHQNAHFVVHDHVASGYVCIVRTTQDFASVTHATRSLTECKRALTGIETQRYGVLFDWRASRKSSDPALHKVLVEQVDAMAVLFARRAILVATAIGAMQANRVARSVTGGQMLPVFDDEAAAIEHVTAR